MSVSELLRYCTLEKSNTYYIFVWNLLLYFRKCIAGNRLDMLKLFASICIEIFWKHQQISIEFTLFALNYFLYILYSDFCILFVCFHLCICFVLFCLLLFSYLYYWIRLGIYIIRKWNEWFVRTMAKHLTMTSNYLMRGN